MKMPYFAIVIACLLGSRAGAAQSTQPVSWDTANPPVNSRKIPIKVGEGTWMNVDVSPDGSTLAFDLLGDIYLLPITGGVAKRIAEGVPFEVQPRFSPDGTKISFTSDRGGGDNIWIMDRDGANKRQLTSESFTLLNNAAWSPDGRYIVARKHFTTQRSAGTGELWLYHISGGAGVPLVERVSSQHQKELGEPIFSPSGSDIYFSRDTTPGAIFEYAQDTNEQVYAIERLSLASGERTTVVGGPGGAVRPSPSPDGRMLAYVRREQGKSKLFVLDLASGSSRKVYENLDLDMQETWAVYGVYPNMGWTPDSRSLVFWAGGKIQRVNADGGGHGIIPFSIDDSRDVTDPIRPHSKAFSPIFNAKMPRFAVLSPDARQVVFESLGRLYIKALPSGVAKPLTRRDSDFQIFPSWSRDGKSIVFVSWDDQRLGEIRIVSADGSKLRTVTDTPGHYRRPRFSPDGATIVFERGRKGVLTSERYAQGDGIYRVSANGGPSTFLIRQGGSPHFGASSDRVFVAQSVDSKLRLVSVDFNGKEARIHAEGDLVTSYEVSPNGDALAFRENYNVFVVPFREDAKSLDVSSKTKQLPLKRVSSAGGQYPSWSGDGQTLAWTLGPQLIYAKKPQFDLQPSAEIDREVTASLAREVVADAPLGLIAFVGAKLVTMADERGGIISDGVVLVSGNKIVATGRRGQVAIPTEARQIDVTGKVIIPGIVDAHAHGPAGEDELVPQQNWDALAHLAFGVTTTHNPSSVAGEIFPAAEMQKAGIILAPRTFSSGESVFGARNSKYAVINSYQDALEHVRRLKAQGALSIKNYNQPRRDQRQQLVSAARAENILVVAEGGSLFGMDLTIIADGNSSLEHNLPTDRQYEDVRSFFSQTKVSYTPTLGVTYGGLAGDPYWSQATQVWKHPLLTRFVPADQLAERVRVTTAPDNQFVDQYSAREARQLAARGVSVAVGGHGQQQGLAAHWEMWSLVRGGWTPIEALRAATKVSAESLGLNDLGSIEPGKLADLVVLDEDPVLSIRNSDKVSKVMLNGRLYDASTMNEEVTGNHKTAPMSWQR